MGQLTLSMEEAVKVFKNSLMTELEKVKEVEVFDNNKLKAVIELNKFLPPITAVLSYNSFSKGILKYNIQLNNSSKLVTSLLKNINLDLEESNILTIENDILIINIKDALDNYLAWLNIKDIKLSNNSLVINLQVDDIKTD